VFLWRDRGKLPLGHRPLTSDGLRRRLMVDGDGGNACYRRRKESRAPEMNAGVPPLRM
jgi:hypothetical protein